MNPLDFEPYMVMDNQCHANYTWPGSLELGRARIAGATWGFPQVLVLYYQVEHLPFFVKSWLSVN